MLEQILKLHSNGQLSDGATLAVIYELQYGSMDNKLLASKMHRSTRSIQTYRSEMKNISPVSSINKQLTNKNEDNETIKDNMGLREKIFTILDKYGVTHLTYGVEKFFIEHPFNEKALEYIVKYCVDRHRRKIVRSLPGYLIYNIGAMWDEAVGETSREINVTVPSLGEIDNFTQEEVNIPSSPEARSKWNLVLEKLSEHISPAALNSWFKTAIPICIKNSTLYVFCGSFAKEYILAKYKLYLSVVFSELGLQFELTSENNIAC